jgi:hypothetical protein
VFKGKCTSVIAQLQETHAPFVEGVHCMVSNFEPSLTCSSDFFVIVWLRV